MKLKICLTISVFLLLYSCKTVEEYNEENNDITEANIIHKIEYSYAGNHEKIYYDLINFLKNKWNLDDKYAVQVLGFCTGYMMNHDKAVDYYKIKREEIKNRRLVEMLDDICERNIEKSIEYIKKKRLNEKIYLWFVCFGNYNDNSIDYLLDVYNLADEDDLAYRMELRYFYERHDLIKKLIKERDEEVFQTIENTTYDELKKQFWSKIRNLKIRT